MDNVPGATAGTGGGKSPARAPDPAGRSVPPAVDRVRESRESADGEVVLPSARDRLACGSRCRPRQDFPATCRRERAAGSAWRQPGDGARGGGNPSPANVRRGSHPTRRGDSLERFGHPLRCSRRARDHSGLRPGTGLESLSSRSPDTGRFRVPRRRPARRTQARAAGGDRGRAGVFSPGGRGPARREPGSPLIDWAWPSYRSLTHPPAHPLEIAVSDQPSTKRLLPRDPRQGGSPARSARRG